MNLHGIVRGAITAVNPDKHVEIRISAGSEPTQPSGFRNPAYETPGSITASIAGTVMTVTGVDSGVLRPGQTLADETAALLPGTMINAQLTGTDGAAGTYAISRAQTVAAEGMSTAFVAPAQIQPTSWKDIQQLDGMNISGERRKIYIYGTVDGLVRVKKKGGDLVLITGGVNDGIWLVAQTLEQFPDWISAVITLQNDKSFGAGFAPSLDFSKPQNSQYLPVIG